MWIAAAIAAASAYASSEAEDDRQRQQQDDSLEMLRERYRLDREDREMQRQYMNDAFNAWSGYGMGGEQAGNLWNQQANFGLLNPQAFRQQYGQRAQMPWGGG